MQFKPHAVARHDSVARNDAEPRHDVVPGDEMGDDSNEFSLPVELEQLAGQLRCDADQLSTAYPASRFDLEEPGNGPAKVVAASTLPAGKTKKTAVIASTLTVVALLIAVPLALVASGVFQRPHDPFPRLVTDNQPVETMTEPASGSLVEMSPELESPQPFLPTKLTPVLLLQEASGPEAEGLLDLLEDGEGSKATLSI